MLAGDVSTPRTSSALSDQADRLLDRVLSIKPAVRCSYEIGAQHIAVHYLSEELFSRLHPSLAHLATASDSPAELTIIAQVSESPPLQLTNDEWTAACRRWSQSDAPQDAPSANFTPGDGGRLDLIAPARRIALSSFRNLNLLQPGTWQRPFAICCINGSGGMMAT